MPEMGRIAGCEMVKVLGPFGVGTLTEQVYTWLREKAMGQLGVVMCFPLACSHKAQGRADTLWKPANTRPTPGSLRSRVWLKLCSSFLKVPEPCSLEGLESMLLLVWLSTGCYTSLMWYREWRDQPYFQPIEVLSSPTQPTLEMSGTQQSSLLLPSIFWTESPSWPLNADARSYRIPVFQPLFFGLTP